MTNQHARTPVQVFTLLVAFILFSRAGLAAEYEQPPVFNAAELLSESMLKGENFKVNEKVTNEGFMNNYTIETKWGSFNAKSDAQLRLGLHEVAVMATIEEMLANDEVTEAAKEQGTGSYENAKNLLSDPEKILDGAVEGAKKLFSLGKRALNDDSAKSVQEDSTWESLVGFSGKKRKYAAELKVDPYTTNPLMQEALDKLTWTGHSAKLASSFLISLIPVVGLAATVSNTTDLLNEVLVLKSPLELREINIKSLNDLGINQTVIDLFMQNAYFTPTSQTLYVQALAAMGSVKGLENIVGIASVSSDVENTILRQRQMQMYANYHQNITPVTDFLSLGSMVYARTKDGRNLVVAPIDYLTWTKGVHKAADTIKQESEASTQPPVLWLTGKASEKSAALLKELGWELHENAEKTLLGNKDKG